MAPRTSRQPWRTLQVSARGEGAARRLAYVESEPCYPEASNLLTSQNTMEPEPPTSWYLSNSKSSGARRAGFTLLSCANKGGWQQQRPYLARLLQPCPYCVESPLFAVSHSSQSGVVHAGQLPGWAAARESKQPRTQAGTQSVAVSRSGAMTPVRAQRACVPETRPSLAAVSLSGHLLCRREMRRCCRPLFRRRRRRPPRRPSARRSALRAQPPGHLCARALRHVSARKQAAADADARRAPGLASSPRPMSDKHSAFSFSTFFRSAAWSVLYFRHCARGDARPAT